MASVSIKDVTKKYGNVNVMHECAEAGKGKPGRPRGGNPWP
eukprot:gene6291-7836_t